MVHQSALFRTAFEDSFGKNLAVPAANDTRWNSVHKQLVAIMKLDSTKLNEVLISSGQQQLVLSQKETLCI